MEAAWSISSPKLSRPSEVRQILHMRQKDCTYWINYPRKLLYNQSCYLNWFLRKHHNAVQTSIMTRGVPGTVPLSSMVAHQSLNNLKQARGRFSPPPATRGRCFACVSLPLIGFTGPLHRWRTGPLVSCSSST